MYIVKLENEEMSIEKSTILRNTFPNTTILIMGYILLPIDQSIN